MSEPESNEILAQDISYIKADILESKKKLDEKYVSHETFDLTVKALQSTDSKIINTAMFFAAPLYAGIIALLFKLFS